MGKTIKLNPVAQAGHICKTTAIAAVDQYYGKQIGFKPIPLHKGKTYPISIRELSKNKGSVQGELLEIRQLTDIFKDIGYETELVDFREKSEIFKNTIKEQIDAGNLIVACFAVNIKDGQPRKVYSENEHAAIIHGYNEEGELDFAHWGIRRKTTMQDFYDSSMVLPETRESEYYKNVKAEVGYPKNWKYDLHQVAGDMRQVPTLKKSITPQKGTGFKGRLLVIKKPKLENILEARTALLSKNEKKKIDKLLGELKRKTDELIEKGNRGQKSYQNVSKVALKLISQLDTARDKFFNGEIKLDAFKNDCQKAIQEAVPEFEKHRGWHQLNPVLNAFLGVLAVLTIIPAIVVHFATKGGYTGTFFSYKTDAAKKLASFKSSLNVLNVEPKSEKTTEGQDGQKEGKPTFRS